MPIPSSLNSKKAPPPKSRPRPRPHGVMQMRRPRLRPPPPPSLRGGAAGRAPPRFHLRGRARGANRPSVRPAAPGPPGRRAGTQGRGRRPPAERAPQQGRWTQAAPCLLWPGSQWLCPVPWGSPSRWPPAAAVTLRGWRRRLVGSPRALWQRPTPSAGLAFTMAGGRPQPKRSFSIIPCFVFVESVLLGFVVLLAYRLEFTDTFTVHAQGFFCYDSTYAKPYPGPEAASRAPPALVYALVTAGPTLTILLGELARAFFPAPPSAISTLGESTIVSGACCRFSPPLRRLVRFLGGDGQPHAALPVRLPPQLHGPGLPAALARPPRPRPLRHRPGRLRRQPQPGGRRAPRLPLQGRGALRLRGHLHGDVRDPRVPREGLPPGQAVALPGPAVSCLLGGRGAGGRVPQPLVRRAGRLPDRSGHRRLPGHLRRAQLPEQATLWPEALPVGEPGPGPLRGQPPRKVKCGPGTRGLQATLDTGTAHPIQAAELRPPWPPNSQLRVLAGPGHVFVAPRAPPSTEVGADAPAAAPAPAPARADPRPGPLALLSRAGGAGRGWRARPEAAAAHAPPAGPVHPQRTLSLPLPPGQLQPLPVRQPRPPAVSHPPPPATHSQSCPLPPPPPHHACAM
ncbi:phospholipid phosphatase-related protein type 2 isoform X3 [Dasypus novemcinctus]|uniref:phospholipid phosphatase-related protein type 2 isoform X3 n=1 Tax=Dasypus novemcinctus TaxID=9361 RepID=UPI00265FFE37|nr:phospholipid phosphatase-related protein type 2 isoform X3 [Dasypus novemcinctus]